GDFLAEAGTVGIFKGGVQRQEFVECDAQAVDVAPRVGPAVEPFRSHVAQRPHDIAGAGQLVGAPRLGESDIGDPDRSAGSAPESGFLGDTDSFRPRKRFTSFSTSSSACPWMNCMA